MQPFHGPWGGLRRWKSFANVAEASFFPAEHRWKCQRISLAIYSRRRQVHVERNTWKYVMENRGPVGTEQRPAGRTRRLWACWVLPSGPDRGLMGGLRELTPGQKTLAALILSLSAHELWHRIEGRRGECRSWIDILCSREDARFLFSCPYLFGCSAAALHICISVHHPNECEPQP